MGSIINFIVANYTWFIVGSALIFMALIGFIAEKTNFGRGVSKEIKETPKVDKVDEETKTEEVAEVQPVPVDTVVEVTPQPQNDPFLDMPTVSTEVQTDVISDFNMPQEALPAETDYSLENNIPVQEQPTFNEPTMPTENVNQANPFSAFDQPVVNQTLNPIEEIVNGDLSQEVPPLPPMPANDPVLFTEPVVIESDGADVAVPIETEIDNSVPVMNEVTEKQFTIENAEMETTNEIQEQPEMEQPTEGVQEQPTLEQVPEAVEEIQEQVPQLPTVEEVSENPVEEDIWNF